MDLTKASEELLTETYVDLIKLLDDFAALESEADAAEELDPAVSELANLRAELQDEVRMRGIDEHGLRRQARDE